jgi:hypothetical protein
MKFELNKEKKRNYIIAFLLDQMTKQDFGVMLEGHNSFLEPFFVDMLASNLVAIEDDVYQITEKGEEVVYNHNDKYSEFLKFYDIFCAVDLNGGTFAFSKIFDFETDDEWFAYLNQDNWSDVRIAVCEFKKIDPIEIVFLSFLNEGRFDTEENKNWQFDLVSDLIWDEMLAVCNTAIPLEDLLVDDAIQDIIKQGTEIVLANLKEDNRRKLEELKANITEEEYEEEIVIVEEEIVYYEEYYDPYYVSPCWVWYWY